MTVYCDKHINTLCGQSGEFYCVKVGGTYIYHYALKSKQSIVKRMVPDTVAVKYCISLTAGSAGYGRGLLYAQQNMVTSLCYPSCWQGDNNQRIN